MLQVSEAIKVCYLAKVLKALVREFAVMNKRMYFMGYR